MSLVSHKITDGQIFFWGWAAGSILVLALVQYNLLFILKNFR